MVLTPKHVREALREGPKEVHGIEHLPRLEVNLIAILQFLDYGRGEGPSRGAPRKSAKFVNLLVSVLLTSPVGKTAQQLSLVYLSPTSESSANASFASKCVCTCLCDIITRVLACLCASMHACTHACVLA